MIAKIVFTSLARSEIALCFQYCMHFVSLPCLSNPISLLSKSNSVILIESEEQNGNLLIVSVWWLGLNLQTTSSFLPFLASCSRPLQLETPPADRPLWTPARAMFPARKVECLLSHQSSQASLLSNSTWLETWMRRGGEEKSLSFIGGILGCTVSWTVIKLTRRHQSRCCCMKLYKKGMKKMVRAQRRITSMVWGQEHTTSEERRRKLGLLSREESRGGGRALLAAFSCITEWFKRRQSQTLLRGTQRKDKGNGHKLQQGKFHLYVKKKKKDCESS